MIFQIFDMLLLFLRTPVLSFLVVGSACIFSPLFWYERYLKRSKQTEKSICLLLFLLPNFLLL